MEKLKIKYKAFKRELKIIESDFTIINVDYESKRDWASISYTDGYIEVVVMYKYIEDINFWSITDIF